MDLNYENKKILEGYSYVIGCDEVGRGCLAGPVVAASVVFSPDARLNCFKDVNDSKKLSAKKREQLAELIKEKFLWSIAEVSAEVVDEINIHNASLLAMRKALRSVIPEVLSASRFDEALARRAEKLSGIQSGLISGSRAPKAWDDVFVFIDGKFSIPELSVKQDPVVGGDAKIFSIAAASIIAKVYRDKLMEKFHETYPVYNLAKHKGYATLHHRNKITEHGLSPIHRISFCKNFI